MRSASTSTIVLVACAMILVHPALGQESKPTNNLGIMGGVFVPYSGDTGFMTAVQYLANLSDSFRLGAEIEYRNFSARLLSVDNVDIDTVLIRAVSHYVFLPDGPVQPYLGLGLGLGINIIDTDKIEDERPNVDVFSKVGVGIGVVGIGGIEVPLGRHFALFGEGRAGYDFQLTSTSGDVDADNLGGYGGSAGVRFRF